MRTFIKKLKNSIWGKILKFLFNVIKLAVEIFIIAIAIIIVTQRLTNNEKSFLGFRIFNVASGSMEPEYAVGDILIAKEKDPSTIKIGDNIVYLGAKSDYKGKIITHAVINIEQDENGEYLFHTKGIANTTEDPVVHEGQLYGVVVNNNIVLAWLCKVLTNRYGLYFFVIIPITLFAFVEFVKAQGRKIEEERAEEAKQKEKQKEEAKEKEQPKEETKPKEQTNEEAEHKEQQKEEAENLRKKRKK